MNAHRLIAAALLLAGLFAHPHSVRAAQSYDNCAGTITTLPTTISTQGVWCLKGDLATNIASGNAITIAANNVTIDCNDFKIGGLAAGNGSFAKGIYSFNRQNVTVRHCNMRGFAYGMQLDEGGGHLVEDNRLDNNLYVGIQIRSSTSSENLVQRNRVYDTGGATGESDSVGIVVDGDAIDNVVSGLFTDVPGNLAGIMIGGDGNQTRGNKVTGFSSLGLAEKGIYVFDGNLQRFSGNQVIGYGFRPYSGDQPSDIGIGSNIGRFFCSDNTVSGFQRNVDDTVGTCSGNLTI